MTPNDYYIDIISEYHKDLHLELEIIDDPSVCTLYCKCLLTHCLLPFWNYDLYFVRDTELGYFELFKLFSHNEGEIGQRLPSGEYKQFQHIQAIIPTTIVNLLLGRTEPSGEEKRRFASISYKLFASCGNRDVPCTINKEVIIKSRWQNK